MTSNQQQPKQTSLAEDMRNFSKIRDEQCNGSTMQAIAYICKKRLGYIIVGIIILVIIIILIVKSSSASSSSTRDSLPSRTATIKGFDVQPIDDGRGGGDESLADGDEFRLRR